MRRFESSNFRPDRSCQLLIEGGPTTWRRAEPPPDRIAREPRCESACLLRLNACPQFFTSVPLRAFRHIAIAVTPVATANWPLARTGKARSSAFMESRPTSKPVKSYLTAYHIPNDFGAVVAGRCGSITHRRVRVIDRHCQGCGSDKSLAKAVQPSTRAAGPDGCQPCPAVTGNMLHHRSTPPSISPSSGPCPVDDGGGSVAKARSR